MTKLIEVLNTIIGWIMLAFIIWCLPLDFIIWTGVTVIVVWGGIKLGRYLYNKPGDKN